METPNLPPSQQTDRPQQTKEDVPSARPRLDKMWQLPGRVLNELCVKSAAKSASILLVPGSGRPVPLCRPCVRAAARRCVRQDCRRAGDGTTGWGRAGGGGAVGAAAGTWNKPFRHAMVSARFKAEKRQCLAPRWGSPTGAEVGSGSAEMGLPCPARAVAVGALGARGTAAAAFTSGTVHLPEQNRSWCSRSQAAVAG